MQIVKQKKTNIVDAAKGVTIYEYLMQETGISGATTTIDGRYPEIGFATNTTSKELVLVLDGEGAIGMTDKESSIEIGDCILVDRNEKFYWQGNMTLFIVCTPSFKPEQHKLSI